MNPLGAPGASPAEQTTAYLWDATQEHTFLSHDGYTRWMAAHRGVDSARAALLDGTTGVPGLTATQLDAVATWLASLPSNRFLIQTLHDLWRSSRVRNDGAEEQTDLDKSEEGVQLGWEAGLACHSHLDETETFECTRERIHRPAAEYLWDVSKPLSFLHREGFQKWMDFHATLLSEDDDLKATSLNEFCTELTGIATCAGPMLADSTAVKTIAHWLADWSHNKILTRHVQRLWRVGNSSIESDLDVNADGKIDLDHLRRRAGWLRTRL